MRSRTRAISSTRLPCRARSSAGISSADPCRGRFPVPRTFFFATYEGLRDKSATSSLSIVPDAALRSGDFRGGNPIFDPLNLDPSTGLRRPFAGNVIPAARIDPIASRFLELYQPLPNNPGATSNYLDATPNLNTNDNLSGRIDHEFPNHNRLFGRYTFNGERGTVAGSFPLLPSSQKLRAQQAALGYTAAQASWINEIRFSFTRFRVFSVPQSAFKNNIAKELGINGLSDDPFSYGLPFFLVTNFNLRTDDPVLPQVQRDNLWHLSESLAWNRGRHVLKAGFQWTRFHMNYRLSRLDRGRLIFTGAYSAQLASSAPTGDPFADFLLGLPQRTERNVGPSQADLLQNSLAGFLQDDWRVHPRLTLNFGLRYEYVSPFSEERGRLLNLGLLRPARAAETRSRGPAGGAGLERFRAARRAGAAPAAIAGPHRRSGLPRRLRPVLQPRDRHRNL